MTNEDINQIYNQIPNEYFKYVFICNMLCSRTYCHLILNNKTFLEISKPIFDKYKVVFKYIIGYAWLTLRNEESIKSVFVKDDDRFIFDLNTVNKFPMFPFTYDDINQNPYACILINNNIMDLRTNCLTMDMLINYEKYYGVCDSNEFSRRLNIFINGKNEKGLLDKIDWDHFAISGSVMPACAMKYNPLFDIYKTDTNEKMSDNDLLTFFFHYYNNSDIDLICNHEKMHDFLISVSKLISDSKELHKNVTIDNVHTGTIVMSEDLLLFELDNLKKVFKNDNINENYVKSNLENLELKKYFYDKYYKPWKIEKK